MKESENAEDVLKGRLNELKRLAKASLFEQGEISSAFLVNKMASITPNEATTVIKRILSACGYSAQVVRLKPIIASTNSHALSIDAATILSLFGSTTAPAKMTMRDFEGDKITPETAATFNKDAVFSSFFDMEKIKITTATYGLSFANKPSVLTGMKCVRLYDTRFFRQPLQQQATRPTPQRSLDDDRKLKLREEKVAKTNKRNLINTVLGIQQELSLNRQLIFELTQPSSPPETHQQVVSVVTRLKTAYLRNCREIYGR
ncbi:hypothetical protein [Parasitella parasitica]|uniref:Uncharacterized protein n=1 Tax=Parasitella parasitica TaxID=35722 RepID=A0A0B7N0S8_9FUNG|nr:hypothetical protein [Parasitella parasitica]